MMTLALIILLIIVAAIVIGASEESRINVFSYSNINNVTYADIQPDSRHQKENQRSININSTSPQN